MIHPRKTRPRNAPIHYKNDIGQNPLAQDEIRGPNEGELYNDSSPSIKKILKSYQDEPFWNSDIDSYDENEQFEPLKLKGTRKNVLSTTETHQWDINKIVSCLIAMLQGVEVLCSLAIMYLYKDDFHMDPALLGFVLASLRLPWTVKPVWAILSDNFPLLGYRRKSYIILGSFMCVLSTMGIGLVGFLGMWATTFFLLLYFTGSAMCNVIGEALVVEAGRLDPSGDGAAKTVSIFFAFRKFSFAIMSYLSGLLLLYLAKQHIFLIATFLPLSVLVASFFMEEPKVKVQPLKQQLHNLLEIIKEPVLLNSTLFIFLMMCTPSAGAVMFYFMTNELKFSSELLGRMALFQSISSLCGILAYMWFFSKICIRKLLFFSTLIVTPFCLLPCILVQRWNLSIGIPDSAFVVTDTVLMEFIGEFQAMPVLVLAARLCPPGLESTIYSFILSSYNLGLGIGSLMSAGVTAILGITSVNFNNLSILIMICAVTNLLPLSIIFLIPKDIHIDNHLSSSYTKLAEKLDDTVTEESTSASDRDKYSKKKWNGWISSNGENQELCITPPQDFHVLTD